MIRYLIICLTSLFFLPIKAQVSGIVFDLDTKQAIPYATVYIDGSTKGTTTNNDGHFSLSNVDFPCQLIVSHISYQIQSKQIKEASQDLQFHLKQGLVKINEFRIEDKNERTTNLKNFKRWFLGNDFWGRNAEILNDSILHFSTSSDSCFSDSSNDSIIKKVLKTKTYHVHADGPIWVRLPLLGYRLRVDLLDYRNVYDKRENQSVSSYLGFFHFIPFEEMSRRDRRVFTNNRRMVYYNSRQHFGRSLIEGKLAENGYELWEVVQKDSSNGILAIDANLKDHMKSQGEITSLIGLSNKTFVIKYYPRYNSKPFNLEKRLGSKYEESKMQIISDTTLFYSSGYTPNCDVMYGGFISDKKIGSFLPYTYSPTEDLKK